MKGLENIPGRKYSYGCKTLEIQGLRRNRAPKLTPAFDATVASGLVAGLKRIKESKDGSPRLRHTQTNEPPRTRDTVKPLLHSGTSAPLCFAGFEIQSWRKKAANFVISSRRD